MFVFLLFWNDASDKSDCFNLISRLILKRVKFRLFLFLLFLFIL